MAAGGLNATEMNVGRSVAEWNPVSIVAVALRKGMCIPFVKWRREWLRDAMPGSKWSGYERGVMERNEGRNE